MATTMLGTVVICVVVLLVGFVLLPLLGVALELVFVLFLLFSGILGRVVLLPPWRSR